MIATHDYSNQHSIHRRFHNIAIGGRKGNGKDCLAQYLAIVYGYNRVAFATPLRLKAARQLVRDLGMTIDEALRVLEHPAEKEKFRVLMQNIGMEEREKDKDHWVKESGIITAQGLNVVSDARFMNEVLAIERKPGISIFVRARWAEKSISEDATLGHVSEALGPESYNVTATVPYGIVEAVGYYDRLLRRLFGFPKPDEGKIEEFGAWMSEHIERGNK